MPIPARLRSGQRRTFRAVRAHPLFGGDVRHDFQAVAALCPLYGQRRPNEFEAIAALPLCAQGLQNDGKKKISLRGIWIPLNGSRSKWNGDR